MPEIELVKHETCLEYYRRRLSEGWKCISLEGHNAVLLSPDGVRRELDLRNDIETLRPNAAGDEENIPFATSGVGHHHEDVDDVEPDDDVTRVMTNLTSTRRDLYNLSAPSGSGTINWIKVYYRWRGSPPAYAGYLIPAIKTGGVVYEGAQDTTAYYDTASYQWTVNPQTEVAWTWDDLASLQAGIRIKAASGAECRCTQVYVEVDYAPPPEQELTASPVATASSVQAGAIAGSGNAPLTSSPVAATSSIQASAIVGTGIAPLTSSPIAVVSSIQQATLTAEGEAPLTASPVTVASSVQVAVIEKYLPLFASPVAVVSSVQTASIVGSGEAPLTAVAVAVASSIQNAALAGVGAVILTSAPIQVTSSIVAAAIAGTGIASLTALPIAVIASVLAARAFLPGRPLSLIVITSHYRKVNVITGYD